MASEAGFAGAAGEGGLDCDRVADFEGRGGWDFAANFDDGSAEFVAKADGGDFFAQGVRVAGHGDEGRCAVFVEVCSADSNEGRFDFDLVIEADWFGDIVVDSQVFGCVVAYGPHCEVDTSVRAMMVVKDD